MPVSALLGYGPPGLTRLGGTGPKVEAKNLSLVGIRSLDEGERACSGSRVQVQTMSDIDRLGIHRIMKKALARVTDGTGYVHVSFDLDAVDPTVAPGVGTPVKGGLDYREAHLIMELLHDSGRMTSLEIVEANPISIKGTRRRPWMELCSRLRQKILQEDHMSPVTRATALALVLLAAPASRLPLHDSVAQAPAPRCRATRSRPTTGRGARPRRTPSWPPACRAIRSESARRSRATSRTRPTRSIPPLPPIRRWIRLEITARSTSSVEVI